MKLLIRLVAATLLIAAAINANAHYLWIDATAAQPVLRFGELEEGAIERSPGRLDEMPGPAAVKLKAGAKIPLLLKRGADGFSFSADARNAALIVQEDQYVVRDWTANGMGIVKPMFYARHAPTMDAVPPAQNLDVVPAGATGQFRLWYRGKPLCNVALIIIAPNGWTQERKTDAEGNAHFNMPWRGQYIVESIYLDAVKGEFGGQRYDSVRHRATLTVMQAQGESTFAPK